MAVSANVLEILIYEEIGEDWWSGGGITPSTISARLKAAGTFDSISIRINSPGGSCFDGIGIYNLLRAQGKPVDVHVDGLAASAASIIAMAGDTISIGTGAMLMIHNASMYCYGEAADLRKIASDLDAISVSAGEIYVKRSGQTAAKVKELMDAESWIGGAQAIELGLATEVVELEGEQQAEARALAQEFATLGLTSGVFRHAPKSLARPSARSQAKPPRAGLDDCECPCAPCVDGDCANCETADCAFEGCTCPQHQEMSAQVDPAVEYHRLRLASFAR